MIPALGQSPRGPRAQLSSKAVLGAVLIAVFLWFFRAGNIGDRIWSDLLTASQKVPVSSDYVVVNIQAQDLVALWDVSTLRQALAEKVTALKGAGAKRVLLDMFLSGSSMTVGDSDLAKAFISFGRDKSAFGRTGDLAFAAPRPHYEAATTLELGMLSDSDGHFRAVRLPWGSRQAIRPSGSQPEKSNVARPLLICGSTLIPFRPTLWKRSPVPKSCQK